MDSRQVEESSFQDIDNSPCYREHGLYVGVRSMRTRYNRRERSSGSMGVPVVSAGESEELLVAYIDTKRVEDVRKKLPAYKDRRPELYIV